MKLIVKTVDTSVDVDAPDVEVSGGGEFIGYASTWGTDLDGDTIERGAWSETLSKDYAGNGAGIPIHWEHESKSPDDIVGVTTSAVEDEHGLLVTAKLFTDTPNGARAYDLLKSGLIHQMSVGFLAEDVDYVDAPDAPLGVAATIHKAKLFEISLVQVAANQEAEVIAVKSAGETSTAAENAPQTADGGKSDDSTKPAANDAGTADSKDDASKGRDGADDDDKAVLDALAALTDAVEALTDAVKNPPKPDTKPDADGESSADAEVAAAKAFLASLNDLED